MSTLFYHRAINCELIGKRAKAHDPERGESIDLRLLVCYAASELPAPPSSCSLPLCEQAGSSRSTGCRCAALPCSQPFPMTVSNAKPFARRLRFAAPAPAAFVLTAFVLTAFMLTAFMLADLFDALSGGHRYAVILWLAPYPFQSDEERHCALCSNGFTPPFARRRDSSRHGRPFGGSRRHRLGRSCR